LIFISDLGWAVKRLSTIVFCSLVVFTGCNRTSSPSAGPPVAKLAEVDVATATTRKIIDYRVYTGRTTAVESVEVRARISGYLINGPRSDSPDSEVKVKEGALIKKGDLLFVIDPQPYQLALQQSEGLLAAAEARLTQANQELTRSETLIDRNAISKAEYDQAIAAVAELGGQIGNLEATLARNRLDLNYTKVESPIDGLLGRAMVTKGNLVVADTTALTTVVAVNPVFVDFEVDEESVLNYRLRILQGTVKSAREVQIPIRLELGNEEGFPHEGTIDFVNNVTDPMTGNTRVRGVFNNDSGILSPGLFARVQVPFTGEYATVLIPTIAIGMDQQGRHVLVVGDDDKVSRRAVSLGEIVDEMTVVKGGIEAGERVVVAGLQKVRPGSEVKIAASQQIAIPQVDLTTPTESTTP
jgi:RND family efflux transporter MFP subunit